MVANAGQPDPPFTRAGSQDYVSYTNSLKLIHLLISTDRVLLISTDHVVLISTDVDINRPKLAKIPHGGRFAAAMGCLG